MAHRAIYGNVILLREFCSVCERWAFVLDNKLQCCEAPWSGRTKGVKRISEPEQVRRGPDAKTKQAVLLAQDYKCVYCEQSFGAGCRKKESRRWFVLKIAWDHMIPFAYSQNNSAENFAASCQVCNGWKSDLIFGSIEEVRIYVSHKWAQEMEVDRGPVSDMWAALLEEEGPSDVL